MLTVKQLLEALAGVDPDAQVVIGIVEGPEFNAAYADHQVFARASISQDGHLMLSADEAVALYICCYEQPRPFDWGGVEPEDQGNGTTTLRFDPEGDDPKGGAR